MCDKLREHTSKQRNEKTPARENFALADSPAVPLGRALFVKHNFVSKEDK